MYITNNIYISRVNFTFSTVLNCLNQTGQEIWNKCDKQAVLPDASEYVQDHFTPWTDTIFDKLKYATQMVERANSYCNKG